MSKGERLPRLLRMIITIQNHPGMTAEQLARECGVGKRQIFRDLQDISFSGAPIFNQDGYRFTENFSLANISFSLEEALTLLYGLKLMKRQEALFPVQRVKERILSLLPKLLREWIEDVEPRVELLEGMTADYSGKAELFRMLNEAMGESRQVEVDYYCFYRDDSETRVIDPYNLLFKDGFWYLYGYCHLRGETRVFRIDRIKNIRPTGKTFTLPARDDMMDSVFASAWGIEHGPEYEFRVRFWGDSARFVRETHFHPSQRVEMAEDGSVIFSAKAHGLSTVSRWILGFGGEAEVLEPKELRAMVRGLLAEGLKRYGNVV